MQNRWVMYDRGLVEWQADLSPLIHHPDQLIHWFQQVLTAAEAETMHTVHAARHLPFQRKLHGTFANFIQVYYDHTGIVHLSTSAIDGPWLVGSTMAYYDTHGQIVEEEICDLGDLWCCCHPTEHSTGVVWWYHQPALIITGPVLPTRDPARMTRMISRVQNRVTFQLSSDIWLPWIIGAVDPSYALDQRFDNRDLARQHTPRLNRFLDEVRGTTIAMGCSWSLNCDPNVLRHDDRFMVHDTGIDLTASLPQELTINKGLPQPDRLQEGKIALQAIESVRHNPHAPRPELMFHEAPAPSLAALLQRYAIPWRLISDE